MIQPLRQERLQRAPASPGGVDRTRHFHECIFTWCYGLSTPKALLNNDICFAAIEGHVKQKYARLLNEVTAGFWRHRAPSSPGQSGGGGALHTTVCHDEIAENSGHNFHSALMFAEITHCRIAPGASSMRSLQVDTCQVNRTLCPAEL